MKMHHKYQLCQWKGDKIKVFLAHKLRFIDLNEMQISFNKSNSEQSVSTDILKAVLKKRSKN